MFLFKLINLLKGYLVVEVYGKFTEKFLNMAITRKIYLWDIKRHKNSITLKIGIDGYKALWPVCRKTGCKMRIKEKRGLPFKLNKLRRRKVFAFGILFFIIVLYISSKFVLFVDVSGLEEIDEIKFNEFLESQNLQRGAFHPFLDIDDIEHQILITFPRIAWTSIEIQGTRVVVNLVEKDLPEEYDHSPTDIVAKKDGLITKLLVLSGESVVEEGDVVTEGETIISGELFNEDTRTHMLVRSLGIVEARVWYQATGEAYQNELVLKETDEQIKKQHLNIFGWNIKIPSRQTYDLKDYYKRTVVTQPLKWRGLEFPINLITNSYTNYSGVDVTYTNDEIVDVAAKRAYRAAKHGIPKGIEIENKIIHIIEKSDDKVKVSVVLETIEDIRKDSIIKLEE
ncbi:sporulation protein YqfD [Proteinivorax hydrogeniformans]|uniref:Sporulation protein YqfD n=1 Tax=Proteinivorax hydrogeniformans TaxID=1826727 RepID=A0AAU8HWL8_9FIRM